jgi:Protein of unknown function (DUF2846)/Domain of unknown function (DUF4440)
MSVLTTLLISTSVFQLLALSSAASQPRQISASQARIELTAVLAERNAALERDDLERVQAFYAPNFVWHAGHGKTITLQELNQLSTLALRPTFLERKYTSEIQEVKPRGEDVVLTVEHTRFERMQYKDGAIRQHKQVAHQQETWIRQGSEWKLLFIDNIKVKQSESLVNGVKDREFMPEAGSVTPNASDQPMLDAGNGLVFIYRIKDFTLVKAPVFCNEQKLASLTGGSFIKIKLSPGKYSFRSDKGEVIEVNVEAGKIQFLSVKLETGFPKGRGRLKNDTSVLGAQAYKLPRLLELNPLGNDNIDDHSKVVVAQ